MSATIDKVVHPADPVACSTAVFSKAAQFVDPHDLDRGGDPDDDHGLTHLRPVMAHVYPPPPPEPPPCTCCNSHICIADPTIEPATYGPPFTLEAGMYGMVFVSGRSCLEQLEDLQLHLQYFNFPAYGECFGNVEMLKLVTRRVDGETSINSPARIDKYNNIGTQ